jgi:hypothetical protein
MFYDVGHTLLDQEVMACTTAGLHLKSKLINIIIILDAALSRTTQSD